MARQEAEQQQDTRATRSEESARAAVVALSQDVSQLKQLVQQKDMELQAIRAAESPRSQDRQRLASSLAAQLQESKRLLLAMRNSHEHTVQSHLREGERASVLSSCSPCRLAHR